MAGGAGDSITGLAFSRGRSYGSFGVGRSVPVIPQVPLRSGVRQEVRAGQLWSSSSRVVGGLLIAFTKEGCYPGARRKRKGERQFLAKMDKDILPRTAPPGAVARLDDGAATVRPSDDDSDKRIGH